jgi:S1-C subfamily serine protease
MLASLTACAASLAGVRPCAAAIVDEEVAIDIYNAVRGSVVSVLGYKAGAPAGVGSGFVWDTLGPHVVTNYHVISKLEKTPQVRRDR